MEKFVIDITTVFLMSTILFLVTEDDNGTLYNFGLVFCLHNEGAHIL